MPIYEYRCATCGFEKEYLQKLSDAPLKNCPECGKPTFSKLISAAGFQLKGSGWYATDFKDGSKPKPESNTKPTAESGPKAKSEESATGAESKAKTDETKPVTPAQAAVN